MDSILIIMTSGPDQPRRCGTPFHFATVAATMDYDVSMYFTIDGVMLLRKGAADAIHPKPGGPALSEFIRSAQESGVEFLACSGALELHDMEKDDLIADVRLAGVAAMWEMAERSKTITF